MTQERLAALVRFEHIGRSFEIRSYAVPGKAPLRLDVHAAQRLLAAPMRDAMRTRELRALLVPGGAVSGMTDVEVREHVATRIALRRLHVYAEPIRRIRYLPEEREAEDEALGPQPEAQVEETAEDRIDVEAQVAVLRQAARDGTPFCEECEKARLDGLALDEAAPPDPFAATDTAAQAEVMRAAALDGIPFCEECDKAARARAQAGA
jgi:hypothetical protein